MPTFLSVSPVLATPYTQWGSDIAEFSSSGPPSASANAKGMAELYGSVSEVKAENEPGLVRCDYPSASALAVVCSRVSARSNTYPAFSPTTTILHTCLSSHTSSYPSSAYIAAYLFASPRVVNHSLLPIGMRPATHSEPPLPPTTSPTSPARDALGLDPDTLRGAPSLQPGTAKEERERRLEAVSHHRKAELPEVLRRVDASIEPLPAQHADHGTSRSAKAPSVSKDAPRNRDRSGSSSSQRSIRKTAAVTVRCTTTPLDWPHPNSAAVPAFPPPTSSSDMFHSPEHVQSHPPSKASTSLTSSASEASVRPAKETSNLSTDTLALVSRPSPGTMVKKQTSRSACQKAVTAERVRANIETLDQCIVMVRDMSRTVQSRTYPTRSEMHQRWLKEGTAKLCDVERVTLKVRVPEPYQPPTAETTSAHSKLRNEESARIDASSKIRVKAPSSTTSLALSTSKSSRSIRQAPTTFGEQLPLTETNIRRLSSIKAVERLEAKDRSSTSVASDSTLFHHVDQSSAKGSQPSPPMSVHSSGGTDGARVKAETSVINSECTSGTVKSACSSRSWDVPVTSSERGSLVKNHSHAESSSARHYASVTHRMHVSSSSSSSASPQGRSDRLPQVHSPREIQTRPSAAPVKARVVPSHGSQDKVTRQARSGSTASVLSSNTSNGSGSQASRSAVVKSKVGSTCSTRSASSHVDKVLLSTSSKTNTNVAVHSRQPTSTASAPRSLSEVSEAPSVCRKVVSVSKQSGVVPSKVEKPKSLASFAQAMSTEPPGHNGPETDISAHDTLTPLARFFTASVVGSTVAAEDDLYIDEDSPFSREKPLPFVSPTFGADVWKTTSWTEVNVMKPHFDRSPSRNSLAGLVVPDTDDHEVLGATSSEESLPHSARRSRAASTVHVMKLPNSSNSTVSTADEHVMRTDPGFMFSGASRSQALFLHRDYHPSGPPPPRYSSLDSGRPVIPPPIQEKGRIIPPQPWLMGERHERRELALRRLSPLPQPQAEVRKSAEIRKLKFKEKVMKSAALELELERRQKTGNLLQKAVAGTRLMLRPDRKKIVQGPLREPPPPLMPPPMPESR